MERVELINSDCLAALELLEDQSVDAVVTDPPAGIGFMGRDWDKDKGGRDEWIAWLRGVMVECRRALKPGGHALVWALPRTSHWTATAIEDAGLEVRDVVHHIFATGFPKSLDVAKAIDKAAGHWRGRAGAITVEFQPAKGTEYERNPKGAPITEEARHWEGWGTALKPAAEHWILARRPLEGPVAVNVLRHGTGALNVDECRVGASGGTRKEPSSEKCDTDSVGGYLNAKAGRPVEGMGRYPAHLMFSHAPECGDACAPGCPVAELDRQSGASRFFYCAKPSKREKDVGLDDLPARSGAEVSGRAEGSAGMNSPRAGVARGRRRNIHPTVKPIALTRYLIRLITPPGGVVLDPFMGSGTTGVAALEEGARFIGVEREAEYFEIARRRVDAALARVVECEEWLSS